MPPPGIAPGLPAPQAGVLLLYYSGSWRIRVSIPVLNLAKVVCYHVQQSPNASTGTRTRILTLEGLNTTLVLWTHDDGRVLIHILGNLWQRTKKKKLGTTSAGFEPTRAEPTRFRVWRLNHSAMMPKSLRDRGRLTTIQIKKKKKKERTSHDISRIRTDEGRAHQISSLAP